MILPGKVLHVLEVMNLWIYFQPGKKNVFFLNFLSYKTLSNPHQWESNSKKIILDAFVWWDKTWHVNCFQVAQKNTTVRPIIKSSNPHIVSAIHGQEPERGKLPVLSVTEWWHTLSFSPPITSDMNLLNHERLWAHAYGGGWIALSSECVMPSLMSHEHQ